MFDLERTMQLYFVITCSDATFQHAEGVARQPQKKKISASSVLKFITILHERIKNPVRLPNIEESDALPSAEKGEWK